jgi:sec-independent protein translocase protein TatA
MKKFFNIILLSLAAICSPAAAFAPSTSTPFLTKNTQRPINTNSLQKFSPESDKSITIKNQRYSVAQVQTMSLFGLGAPEIAVILIAGAFLLGPQKLAELGKDAGKIAGELKEVPKEFQKGLEEGEKQAMATKKKIAGEVEKQEE